VRTRRSVLLVAGLALLQSGNAAAGDRRGADPQIVGAQVALSAQRYYAGAIDAIPGAATIAAVRSFQRRHGLPLTGRAGPATRAALGKLGRPLFGARTIRLSMAGWDVSVLQFLLTLNGFEVGTLDGHFGPRTRAAVVAFQRQSQLAPDTVVGPATRAALCPRPGCASMPSSRAPAAATYRVRTGDTLTAIAARSGTTVAALAEANTIDPDATLFVGRHLRLPRVRVEAAWPRENIAPPAVRTMVERTAVKSGVAPSLALAVAWVESGYQANVRSSTGDWGPMQVSPPAWDFVESVILKRSVPHTIRGNIRVGILYLRHMLADFGGDEQLAVAAYHQGAAGVREHGLLPETQSYVTAVQAVARH
jgi:soluble lytic murein transglycosylase-like protein